MTHTDASPSPACVGPACDSPPRRHFERCRGVPAHATSSHSTSLAGPPHPLTPSPAYQLCLGMPVVFAAPQPPAPLTAPCARALRAQCAAPRRCRRRPPRFAVVPHSTEEVRSLARNPTLPTATAQRNQAQPSSAQLPRARRSSRELGAAPVSSAQLPRAWSPTQACAPPQPRPLPALPPPIAAPPPQARRLRCGALRGCLSPRRAWLPPLACWGHRLVHLQGSVRPPPLLPPRPLNASGASSSAQLPRARRSSRPALSMRQGPRLARLQAAPTRPRPFRRLSLLPRASSPPHTHPPCRTPCAGARRNSRGAPRSRCSRCSR